MSISDWFASLIATAMSQWHMISESRRRARVVLKSPLRLGGKIFSRDELHER